MTSELWIKQGEWWTPVPAALAADWGLIDPDDPPEPEPTPAEKAIDILRPHLAWDHRYRP